MNNLVDRGHALIPAKNEGASKIHAPEGVIVMRARIVRLIERFRALKRFQSANLRPHHCNVALKEASWSQFLHKYIPVLLLIDDKNKPSIAQRNAFICRIGSS